MSDGKIAQAASDVIASIIVGLIGVLHYPIVVS